MKKDNTHDSGSRTKDMCHEKALRYSRRRDFQRGCGNVCSAALRHGWLDEICAHMNQNKDTGLWNVVLKKERNNQKSDFGKMVKEQITWFTSMDG